MARLKGTPCGYGAVRQEQRRAPRQRAEVRDVRARAADARARLILQRRAVAQERRIEHEAAPAALWPVDRALTSLDLNGNYRIGDGAKAALRTVAASRDTLEIKL